MLFLFLPTNAQRNTHVSGIYHYVADSQTVWGFAGCSFHIKSFDKSARASYCDTVISDWGGFWNALILDQPGRTTG